MARPGTVPLPPQIGGPWGAREAAVRNVGELSPPAGLASDAPPRDRQHYCTHPEGSRPPQARLAARACETSGMPATQAIRANQRTLKMFPRLVQQAKSQSKRTLTFSSSQGLRGPQTPK